MNLSAHAIAARLKLMMLIEQAKRIAQVSHIMAEAACKMEKADAMRMIRETMIADPRPFMKTNTAEDIYNKCQIVAECKSLFKVIDGKVCYPNLFSDDPANPFILLDVPDDWHADIAKEVEQVQAAAEREAGKLAEEDMRTAMSKAH